jgi:thiosulfate dehydrogenase (quinone) large subunit
VTKVVGVQVPPPAPEKHSCLPIYEQYLIKLVCSFDACQSHAELSAELAPCFLEEDSVTQPVSNRIILLLFRLLMGWTFLYAGIHHFGDSTFVAGFLSHTKTFHDVYAPLTSEKIAPILTILVEYGHLLIGLSLIFGLFVRLSAPFAMMMMLLYWTAHMDYPYIDNANNYLVDYHIVYALVLLVLIIQNAGRVWGLDGWLSQRGSSMHQPVTQ